MSSIISVESLGKKYILSHQSTERYTALRDVLARGFKHQMNRVIHPFTNSKNDPTHEEFWALNNVSFNVKQGDRVGVVGRNGAGKSTLLKILSRITEPTVGTVKIKGRVASLLEVGTGFHPELTGRENIYLNGAILGMTKAEIKKKFDEIVDFSEVEKFLDTPVKRYSSGMYVRLAFSVAAHLEPEILIVDEVLAVGDARFQAKCLGKMEDVGKEGRTVLFVSHNLNAVRKFCQNALYLDGGHLVNFGVAADICEQYAMDAVPIAISTTLSEIVTNLPEDNSFKLNDVVVKQAGREVMSEIDNSRPLEIDFFYTVLEPMLGFRLFIDLLSDDGGLLTRSFQDEYSSNMTEIHPGNYLTKLKIPAGLLGETNYELRFKAGIYGNRYVIPEDGICMRLVVKNGSNYNNAYPGDRFVGGLITPSIIWETVER